MRAKVIHITEGHRLVQGAIEDLTEQLAADWLLTSVHSHSRDEKRAWWKRVFLFQPYYETKQYYCRGRVERVGEPRHRIEWDAERMALKVVVSQACRCMAPSIPDDLRDGQVVHYAARLIPQIELESYAGEGDLG